MPYCPIYGEGHPKDEMVGDVSNIAEDTRCFEVEYWINNPVLVINYISLLKQ